MHFKVHSNFPSTKNKVPLFPINKQDRALDQSEPELEVEKFCNEPITIKVDDYLNQKGVEVIVLKHLI